MHVCIQVYIYIYAPQWPLCLNHLEVGELFYFDKKNFKKLKKYSHIPYIYLHCTPPHIRIYACNSFVKSYKYCDETLRGRFLFCDEQTWLVNQLIWVVSWFIIGVPKICPCVRLDLLVKIFNSPHVLQSIYNLIAYSSGRDIKALLFDYAL